MSDHPYNSWIKNARTYSKLIGVIMVAGLLGTAGHRGLGAAEGPVAHWALDERTGAEAFDLAGARRDVVVGAPGYLGWRKGVSLGSLHFDGLNTYVRCPATQAPWTPGAFSIELWAAVQAWPTVFAPFLSRRSVQAGCAFGLDEWGRLVLFVHQGGSWRALRSSWRVPVGVWLHLAATFDPVAGASIYVNGALLNHLDVSGTLKIAQDADLLMGCDAIGPVAAKIFARGMYNGLMDEVRLYNRALSRDEIAGFFRNIVQVPVPDFPEIDERYGRDRHRPLFHAIPPMGWTNEPHGLIQHNGRFHLFHQANPAGPYWEQIHWGHLESPDLVHWEHRPLALSPDPEGNDSRGCWSGCSVPTPAGPAILYTAVNGRYAGVNLALPDSGGQWYKHPANPVIQRIPAGVAVDDFRDPFVWKEDGVYQMVIGTALEQGGAALHYNSPDLLNWKYKGVFFSGSNTISGSFWEMPVVAAFGEQRLFCVTAVPPLQKTLYWTGTWRAERFEVRDAQPSLFDIMPLFLSPSIARDDRGRTLAIGILPDQRSSQEHHAAGWAHVFSLPRILNLNAQGKLLQSPVPELAELRDGVGWHREDFLINPGAPWVPQDWNGECMEMQVEVELRDAASCTLALRRSPGGEEETLITYERNSQQFKLDRYRSDPHKNGIERGDFALEPGENLRLHIFIDRSVVEVFANDRGAFATRVYPDRLDSTGLAMFAGGAAIRVLRFEAWPLRPLREQSRLLSRWSMDEGFGSVARDSTYRGFHGEIKGHPRWGPEGLAFDGKSDYVNIGAFAGPAGRQSFTLALELSFSTDASSNPSWIAEQLNGFWLYHSGNGIFGVPPGRLVFGYHGGPQLEADWLPKPGARHEIYAVRDSISGELALFADGKPIGSCRGAEADLPAQGKQLEFGRNTWAQDWYFSGQMRNIRLYGVACPPRPVAGVNSIAVTVPVATQASIPGSQNLGTNPGSGNGQISVNLPPTIVSEGTQIQPQPMTQNLGLGPAPPLFPSAEAAVVMMPQPIPGPPLSPLPEPASTPTPITGLGTALLSSVSAEVAVIQMLGPAPAPPPTPSPTPAPTSEFLKTPDASPKISAEPPRYRLEVFNGFGSGNYLSGEHVLISAAMREGFVFARWFGHAGLLENSQQDATGFFMPAWNVQILAEFSRLSSQADSAATIPANPAPQDSSERQSGSSGGVQASSGGGCILGLGAQNEEMRY